MYCKNCGNVIDPQAAICVKCGFQNGTGMNYCANCGAQTVPGANVCTNCGFALNNINVGGVAVDPSQQKSKMAAGLLGIFLGGFGIHNFYLGFTSKAIIQIIVTLVTCGIGAVWGFIEGIMILTGSINKDANGIPLKD